MYPLAKVGFFREKAKLRAGYLAVDRQKRKGAHYFYT